MSTFPALEAALDEAAHRHYGRRRRFGFSWRHAMVPALTLACGLAAVGLVLPGRAAGPGQEREVVRVEVPTATLALSHALTLAPDVRAFKVSDPVISHAELQAVADALEDATPYPPSERDAFDWLSTASGPTDMASVNYRTAVQNLVEFRAACIWLRFWLANPDDAAARQAAGVVLGDVPQWPTLRDHPGNWGDVPAKLAAGDVAGLDEQNRADCSPWTNRQGG